MSVIDEYLEKCPDEQRAALEKLRAQIRELVPYATEVISYGLPCFKDTHLLVGFAPTKNGCSFYTCSGSTRDVLGLDLKKYPGTKSALHFTPENPLPPELIKRIVIQRIEENAELTAKRKKK